MPVVVWDVLKAIDDDKSYAKLQEQLEQFSLGTPIGGAGDDVSSVSFDESTTARMDDGEVVLE